MADMTDDYARCIAALQAVQLARDCYGSGPEGCKRVLDICNQLQMADPKKDWGKFGGLRTNVANAIARAFFNSDLADVGAETFTSEPA